MASAFSHAVTALSIGAFFYKPDTPKRVWIAGAICSALPDLDSIGFGFGIRYGDFWGHRGFTHSIFFAAVLAFLIVVGFWRMGVPGLSAPKLWAFLFLATSSHGLLDAITNGGLGIAFFSPFQNGRYFLPWRPVEVAPISIARFFSGRGVKVMGTEFLWIWIPSMAIGVTAFMIRRDRDLITTHPPAS